MDGTGIDRALIVIDGDQERDTVFAKRVRPADVLGGDPVDDLPAFVAVDPGKHAFTQRCRPRRTVHVDDRDRQPPVAVQIAGRRRRPTWSAAAETLERSG